ncbi:hypothetical protein NLJ89_g924 [Agrocybe chaxingu]|uniref:Exonuclease 1 n=1 Tax=Agrocybe chaxingu TaxID=84603 RepID=A0A9W8N0Y6_9AGAR|nr:hypothetical protein NLJ89_g924 [Agrocybe chaxingu]
MGVQGLTPFLQKTCPHVLKKLPNRFQSLRGKRVVIDGTLITQRFHFVQNGHPYHHILGWYRLLQELQDNGVSAVCVFDGKERSSAKARELQRRLGVRLLANERKVIEEQRLQRLNGLKDAVHQLQDADPDVRNRIAQSLKDTALGVEDSGISALLEESERLSGEGLKVPEPEESPAATETTELPPTTPLEEEKPTSAESSSKIASTLHSLFLSYKANVAKLVSLSIGPFETPPPPAVPSATTEEEGTEQIMTKAQHQLTVEEGKFWRKAADALLIPVLNGVHAVIPKATETELDRLLQQSSFMAVSFERRTKGPSGETFRQSKRIIEAMGVPCIESTGAVEAEALASSIVLGGSADYVISEDTDVLVYDAPLIRNSTNRLEPLLVMSGQEIRSALNMDHNTFIDFALLLGTDFSQRIANVGPQRAYKFLQNHASIEPIVDIVETVPRYDLRLPRDAYLAQIDIARQVFQNLPPVPPEKALKPTVRDQQAVVDILQQYQLGRLLDEPDYEGWEYDAHYRGNYFNDNPNS